MKLLYHDKLIASAQTVNVTDIDQSYTDLLILFSGRTDKADPIGYGTFYVNGVTTPYQTSFLQGTNDSTLSGGTTAALPEIFVNGASTSASTFGIVKIHIPNYTSSSTFKQMNINLTYESMSFTAFYGLERLIASEFQSYDAIDEITFDADSSDNYVAGTTISIYGILAGSGSASVSQDRKMAEILQKLIINCATGEKQYIPLTAEEIAEREARALEYEAQRAAEAEAQAQAEADKASAISKLTALGLTEAEALALVGQ